MPRAEPSYLTHLKHCIKTLVYCAKISRQLKAEITPDHLSLLYVLGVEPDLTQAQIIRTTINWGLTRNKTTIQERILLCESLGWLTRTRLKHAYLHTLTIQGRTFLIDAERAIRTTRIRKHAAIVYNAKMRNYYYHRDKAAKPGK